MTGNRIHVLDNVKGLLIVLVVVGHYLPQIPQWNQLATCVHELVFLFHMPLFVLVSGLFAKSVYRDGRLRVEKVLSALALAFVYQAVLIALERPDRPLVEALLDFRWAPWYLVSLATWYALVPAFDRLRPVAGVGLALAASLAAGCTPAAGDVLSFGRTLVFMPWFAAGYYLPLDAVARFRGDRRSRPVAVAAGVFVVGWFALGLCDANPFFEFKYVLHADAYRDGALVGTGERLLGFAAAALVSAGLLRALPDRRTPLAVLGERTLQIYVLHRVARPFLKAAGVFGLPLFSDPVSAVLAAVAVSALVAAACAWGPLGRPFDALMRARWQPLLRAERAGRS